MNESLLPLFKWTGGKRREIPILKQFYPDYVKSGSVYNFVEPFCGAAAVFWGLNNLGGFNVVNDFEEDISNFFVNVRDQNSEFLNFVSEASLLYESNDADAHSVQEANYYRWRDLDKDDGLRGLSSPVRAARFWIVNQLAFSGMRRFNSRGEFNVPYGHYKNLNCSGLSDAAHVDLLKNTEICSGDYRDVVVRNDSENTFIFLDPPYTRVMKTYSADNEFGDSKQYELAETLFNLKRAHFMVVIDKSDLTMGIYKDYIKHIYELSYGVNIKNRFSTAVSHIVATNYDISLDNSLTLF